MPGKPARQKSLRALPSRHPSCMASADSQAVGATQGVCGIGPVSIREAARRVGRDVKVVHSDITALLNAGVLDRAAGGGIVFPFDAVKVEFMLQAT